jgi:hypothetical protein
MLFSHRKTLSTWLFGVTVGQNCSPMAMINHLGKYGHSVHLSFCETTPVKIEKQQQNENYV